MALADLVPYVELRYAFDEASGNAIESIGGLDATETSGTIDSIAGKLGNARDFEVDDTEYFALASNAVVSLGDEDVAFLVWVNLESTGDTRTVFSKYGGSVNAEYALFYFQTTGKWGWECGGAGGASDAFSAESASTGTWTLLGVCHDATNNQIGISVDGGNWQFTSHAHGIGTNASDFEIGRYGSLNLHWDGGIDELILIKGIIPSNAELDEAWNSGDGVAFPDWEGGEPEPVTRLYTRTHRPRPFCPAREKAIQGAIN